jgi:DNA polymerase (family 10)
MRPCSALPHSLPRLGMPARRVEAARMPARGLRMRWASARPSQGGIVDNVVISRILAEIGDLLEIKGENPFKIRAYRNAADTVVHAGARVADLAPGELLELPGIGRDLAAKIREIVETGDTAYHRELLEEFPPTILDLLHLQGVGPKTVRQLYAELGIRTLDDLESAARSGALTSLRGMGPRKQALILQALDERRRHAGRHLLPDAHDAAAALVGFLRSELPGVEFIPVGSLRRGCETCGDLDVLAVGADARVMQAFTSYRLVERVLGHGDTKSSVLLQGGLQADVRLVAPGSRGAAMQYFTGSKAHNIQLRDRAIAYGFKLNEYGLFRHADDSQAAGGTEEGIYEALGLPWIPPELREGRGEIDEALTTGVPRLIELADLRGDLHAHTTATDGRDDIEAMALAARTAGLQYLAITDHSQSLAMANGLDEARAAVHAARIRAVNARLEGITLLAGIECDIRADGTLDLATDCLASLDYVVASIHSNFGQEPRQMADRLLRAIECPWVDAIGHPTGRLLLRRDPYLSTLDEIFDAAARTGVAMEINAQINRLDLSDVHARRAIERGVRLVIASDAHSQSAFGVLRWGVQVARRAGARRSDVLNTQPAEELARSLRRHRSRAGGASA